MDNESRKLYKQQHYLKNKERYLSNNLRRKQERKRLSDKIKLESGCVRCGFKEHPAALDFHHKDPTMKEVKVAGLIHSWGIEKMMKEIAKCEVLCANCHRIEHHGSVV